MIVRTTPFLQYLRLFQPLTNVIFSGGWSECEIIASSVWFNRDERPSFAASKSNPLRSVSTQSGIILSLFGTLSYRDAEKSEGTRLREAHLRWIARPRSKARTSPPSVSK
jgi:hypothetical protein